MKPQRSNTFSNANIFSNNHRGNHRSITQQTRRHLHASLLVFSALFLAACASSVQQVITEDGLSGVSSPMDELYIRSGSQFGQYQQIYFEPLTVTYSKQRRSDTLNRRAEDFQFDDKEMAIFEEKFQTSFSQQWQQNLGWSVAEQPDTGVLIVRATVSELFLYASIKNDARSPNASLTNETSKMQLQIELLDAANQQVLLRMHDQKTTGRSGSGSQQMRRVTSVSYWNDAQRMFRQTANNLSNFLSP